MNDLKNISIRQFLARRGILPKYERNGYGMYLSPLREERTPSFKVDYVRNLWYDFGLGEGGTLLTLVMRLERCDSREAVRRLQNGEKRDAGSASLSPSVGERPAVGGPSPVVRLAAVPALRILSDDPLRHPALIGYLVSRGIVPSVAAAFCREVRYEVNGRAFFAVGFRNDAGGWELRSERFKGGSSPKHITTLDNRSDTVIAFEGFMDFLAYLSLKHPERLRIDAAVLNSVVNLPKAIPFLSRHPVIHAFFDNDEAGRKTTSDLIRLCPRSEVIDQSSFYSGHKDVNDYLIARIKDRPKTTKTISDKQDHSCRNNLQALKAERAEIEPPRRKGVKI
ncbi:toprim domain-containing protein [Alistipes sp.]|uniref:toprim domain-containing protein n=1 Tax=Alistipes TaxID=239759 RepID=UPI0028440DCB|nr:toprim domain-containing protein [Alistipes sp.]MDR3835450.1 toprim domain-containing protein [Alistipes sp.]